MLYITRMLADSVWIDKAALEKQLTEELTDYHVR